MLITLLALITIIEARCETRTNILDNSTNSVFILNRVRVGPGFHASIFVDDLEQTKREFEECGVRWDDNNFDRKPVFEQETRVCDDYSHTIHLATESLSTSVWHILCDNLFTIYYTLQTLQLRTDDTRIVVLTNYGVNPIEPFRSSIYKLVFDHVPVWSDRITPSCFQNVIIGFFHNMKTIKWPNVFQAVWVKELARSMLSLRENVLSKLSLNRSTHDIVFLHRPYTSSNRFITNEKVLAALAPNSHVADMARLPLTGQLSIFASNNIFVGVEGAAMCQLMFSPAGTNVVQIRHPDYTGAWQSSIMQYFNITNVEWPASVSLDGGVFVDPVSFAKILRILPLPFSDRGYRSINASDILCHL